MSTLTKAILSGLAVVGVTACGGGGSGAAPAAPAATFTQYTQNDAKTVAGTGLVFINLATIEARSTHAFFAAFLQSYINASTGGSTATGTLACLSNGQGSGTFSSVVTKAGSYSGLRANDTVQLTFNGCGFGSSPALTLNGAASLTPKATYLSLPAAFAIQYDVNTTNFDFIFSTYKSRVNGNQSVSYDATANGTAAPEINVLAGSGGYTTASFIPATATTLSASNAPKAGTILYSKANVDTTFTAGVTGDVDLATSTASLPFSFNTTTRLSGSTASGSAVPTAGVVSIKSNTLNLQTNVTIQGLNATVSADTNQDGTLDLTFTTPYSLLTSF